ncbi:hypothetical protein O181_057167 [Austropuccinia psidii MF-1]|uniref:Uncharacterized protein n=1 Tax=Austropuccinia psidii MF-1 TaxID=1389203 RepID=A0A9Q3HV62_9BASI|nr:hypothetical protein [Austropuccinia psidii MF-1]
MAPLPCSKLTELPESSPFAPPSSVLCGSGIILWLASSGHCDPAQTYYGYKEVEALDPAFEDFLAKGKDCFQNYNPRSSNFYFCFVGKKPCHCTALPTCRVRRYLWSKKDGPFEKDFPVSEDPTPDGTSGYSNFGGRPIYSSSEFPISRLNTEGVVKQIRQTAYSPPDPDAEVSDELDGEEVEVVQNSAGKQSSTSRSNPPAKRFKSQIIPSTPRTFQLILFRIPTSLPPASLGSSTTRHAFGSRSKNIPHPSVQEFPHSHQSTAPTCGQPQ